MSNNTACSAEVGRIVKIIKTLPPKFHITKVVHNYKGKTEKQIGDSVQLEIDNVLLKNPAYKFVNSKSYFNKIGGIELQLNFELK